MPIDWSAFDWPTFGTLMEATATLVVGVAAVAGATRVGLKQVGISERQADIAQAQSEIMRQQLSVEQGHLDQALYDRRLEIYHAAARFLVEAAGGVRPIHDEVRDRFLVALNESRFLFGDSMYRTLDEIWQKGIRNDILNNKMKSDYERQKFFNEVDIEESFQLGIWIADRIATLHESFGALRLT